MTSPASIEALAEEAARHWGGHSPQLLRNRENAVFRITIGGAPAALRLHRMGYQTDQAIWSELWWCAALADAGVPVPAARPALSGDLMITLPGGRRASVIDWIEGEALGIAGQPFDIPVPRLLDLHHSLGALIRRFHEATRGLTLPKGFERPRWDPAGLIGEAPFWGRFWDHPAATPDQRRDLMRMRDFLAESLADHAARVPLQPVHADVLRENVLVRGDALSLIDFDDSGWGFPLYDLGTVMSQNLYEPQREGLFAALCDGYGTADIHMVRVMTLARTGASVGWTMPRLAPDDPLHPVQIARALHCADLVMGPRRA